ISGDEGCHSTNAVLRHGVCAMTGPRMLIFAYTSFHAFVVGAKLNYSCFLCANGLPYHIKSYL
ncbi:MAG: hypothetical protein LBG95_03570, partial [Treponema sp.]|nr:hypothetical protein [Treponema sp.]